MEKNDNNEINFKHDYDYNKYGLGIILCLLLNFVGLIIGVCLYPKGTNARHTFVKAWWITFVIPFALAIMLGIFMSIFNL